MWRLTAVVVYDEHGGCPEIISRSSMREGVPVLTEDDARTVFQAVKALHRLYKPVFHKYQNANCVDVEFVFVQGPASGERLLQLLQCRPCQYSV